MNIFINFLLLCISGQFFESLFFFNHYYKYVVVQRFRQCENNNPVEEATNHSNARQPPVVRVVIPNNEDNKSTHNLHETWLSVQRRPMNGINYYTYTNGNYGETGADPGPG